MMADRLVSPLREESDKDVSFWIGQLRSAILGRLLRCALVQIRASSSRRRSRTGQHRALDTAHSAGHCCQSLRFQEFTVSHFNFGPSASQPHFLIARLLPSAPDCGRREERSRIVVALLMTTAEQTHTVP